MKKFLLFCAGMLLSVSLFAQTKANFAGTWVFNESKSTQAQGGFRMAAEKLVVTQDATSISVVNTRQFNGQTREQNLKYALDGKESENPGFGNNTTSKSTVAWSADGKIMTIKTTSEGGGQQFTTTQTWQLTAEGQLSVENAFSVPQGEMKTTAVYDKK